MTKVTLGSIVQEPLLASEELLQKELKAEGSTPQAYESFVRTSEQEGIAYREEHPPEEEEEFETEEATDTEVTEQASEGNGDEDDAPLTDVVEEEKESTEVTTEALNDWIKEKTQGSNSSFVRNAGELAAGLSKLGITYGPSLLNAMYKGTLWTFSRLGTLIFSASDALSNYIEKSNNSINRLEARLLSAERVIIDQLNDGQELSSFTYKNQKVLNYLKVGGSLDVAGNLRQYATHLTNATSSIASEFEAGVHAIERLGKSESNDRITSYAPFMNVSIPSKGFKPGGPGGYQIRSEFNALCHTDPAWPGDVNLVFSRPKQTTDVPAIMTGFKNADMYISSADKNAKSVVEMHSLSATDLVLVAKSAKILVSACKEVTKTQKRMQSLEESTGNMIKRLFYNLADAKAKEGNADELVNMVYLRAHLSSKVFVKGASSCQTHASRVLSAAVHLLEDHAKRLATKV